MNGRRSLIAALGAGALIAPLAALAQQPGKVWRVGILSPSARPASFESPLNSAFPRGMRELGYVEGKNLELEWRFADGRNERLAALADELVQLKVDVIVAAASAAARAAQQATATIPILFAGVSDPVGRGLVRSLARPGANITGMSNITDDLLPKRLGLLLTMVPHVTRAAVLIHSNTGMQARAVESVQVAARTRKVSLLRLEAITPLEIESAFATMVREKVGAFVVPFTPIFHQQRSQIAELATRRRLPVIGGDRSFAQAGGLMSYGANLADDFYRLATYADKIFKGAKPADLPVEQPTRFELVLNMKTAKSMGLVAPKELLLQAEQVIE